jgi:hypothetical protein
LRSLIEDAVRDPDSSNAADLRATIQQTLEMLDQTVDLRGIEARHLLNFMYDRVQETELKLINSEQALQEEIDWEDMLSWIFVGGDVLQRGFAIEGLIVTWMPRSAGTGQVDVLMQRARWLGYRSDYFAFCRVYLPESVYRDYYSLFADHEDALWRSLGEHLESGGTMEEWSRHFWLDPHPNLRLCRRSTQWFRMRTQPDWAEQLWLPRDDDEGELDDVGDNRRRVDDLIASIGEWTPCWHSSEQNPYREHVYGLVPLADLAVWLTNYSFFSEDRVDAAVMRDAVAVYLEEHPDAPAAVVQMRPETMPGRAAGSASAKRAVAARVPRLGALLAGRSAVSDSSDPRYYPGDRAFHGGGFGMPDVAEECFTFQLHRPRLTRGQEDLTGPDGYLFPSCPLLATYIPEPVRQYRREARGQRA